MESSLLDQLVADLRTDEGERLYAYRDSRGFLTIGIGINIDRAGGGGITAEESLHLCQNRLRAAEADLDRELPWWRNMSSARQRVLVNMTYNLGLAGLLGFHRALAAMQVGDYDKAADEMVDSEWFEEVGARAVRLVALMRKG
jgi:lysozyme